MIKELLTTSYTNLPGGDGVIVRDELTVFGFYKKHKETQNVIIDYWKKVRLYLVICFPHAFIKSSAI